MRRHLPLLALLVLPLPGAAQEWKKDAIKYVQSLQTSTGGFLSMQPRPEIRLRPTLKATSAGLHSLRYLDGKVPDTAGAAKFVAGCYDSATGGFADFAGGMPDIYISAVGVMAIKELDPWAGRGTLPIPPKDKFLEKAAAYLSQAKTFDDVRIAVAGLEAFDLKAPKAKEWLESLAKDRNADGTWGKGDGQARDTGGHAVAWMRLGAKLEHRDAVLKAMRDGQRKDGGWGKAGEPSDLETTYRVMRCFMMLKESPNDVPSLQAFIARCQNKDGGFGIQPGQPSMVAPVYFAAIIEHWLAKK
ncbi:MAG: prenyltransferase/squalene oxidase repeat-containing protein [Gemmataceae bacterium]